MYFTKLFYSIDTVSNLCSSFSFNSIYLLMVVKVILCLLVLRMHYTNMIRFDHHKESNYNLMYNKSNNKTSIIR